MNRSFKTIRVVFLISFLGSLPPGVLTMGVLQSAIQGSYSSGLWFSAGAVMVEIVFIWLVLCSTRWFYQRQYLFRYAEWASFIILLIITLWGFRGLYLSSGTAVSVLPVKAPFMFSGALLRLLTPTFIPFWLGWHLTLLSNKITAPDPASRNISAISAGMGTFTAHGIFLILYFQATGYVSVIQSAGNWIICGVLAVTVLWMGKKLFVRACPEFP